MVFVSYADLVVLTTKKTTTAFVINAASFSTNGKQTTLASAWIAASFANTPTCQIIAYAPLARPPSTTGSKTILQPAKIAEYFASTTTKIDVFALIAGKRFTTGRKDTAPLADMIVHTTP